jgi:hypothetical protein
MLWDPAFRGLQEVDELTDCWGVLAVSVMESFSIELKYF